MYVCVCMCVYTYIHMCTYIYIYIYPTTLLDARRHLVHGEAEEPRLLLLLSLSLLSVVIINCCAIMNAINITKMKYYYVCCYGEFV